MRCRCSFSRRSIWPWAWRWPRHCGERGQAHGIGFATALVFPAVGLALAVLGVETLVTQEALTGDPLVGLVGILLAAIPLVAIVRKWRDLGLLVTGARAATDSEQEVSRRDRASSQKSAASRASCSTPTARAGSHGFSWTS